MKFDIVKYIADTCNDYLEGRHTKAYTLSTIDLALEEDSWQNLCDDKEVIDNIVEANAQKWSVHPDWCIKDKTEDNK